MNSQQTTPDPAGGSAGEPIDLERLGEIVDSIAAMTERMTGEAARERRCCVPESEWPEYPRQLPSPPAQTTTRNER